MMTHASQRLCFSFFLSWTLLSVFQAFPPMSGGMAVRLEEGIYIPVLKWIRYSVRLSEMRVPRDVNPTERLCCGCPLHFALAYTPYQTPCPKMGTEILKEACVTRRLHPSSLILQTCIVDGRHDQPQSTSNQPTPNRPLLGQSDYGDSSWPLYLMYSKIAEEEDNRMVERCQKDKDGTLIIVSPSCSSSVDSAHQPKTQTGLFSATVGALLTISIPDLKPNSQDTSAFYLENIYHLSGNPNVSHPSILSKPPAFSPPTYAIWVNSLWLLSLVVSLSGAMMATIIRNWAVYYIEVTQWPWDTLAKRARIRAFFAEGKWGPDVIWGTGDEPIYLHFSLLLFIAGALIYLFNINRAVFYAVVWWVGCMTISYVRATVAVFFEPHDLLHTPLSPLALRIYLGISYAVSQICSHLPSIHGLRDNTRRHYHELSNRYSKGFLNGKRRAAEEIASKPSSEIDALILERILPTLDDDRALETFFDAIPGFCNSKLSIAPLSFRVQLEIRQALDCFLDGTFCSNFVSESVRASRLITCLNAAHAALGPYAASGILDNIFKGRWDEALQSVEIGHALRLWSRNRDHGLNVQRIVACIIARAWLRDDHWIMLVREVFGVSDRVLRDCLPHGNSVLLSVLIHVFRQANRGGSWTPGILSSLSKFDIQNTLPELQHDFCTLWAEISQEARSQGSYSIPAQILCEIHHLYIALHQGTDAAPTVFSPVSPSTYRFDSNLNHPLQYPLCDNASHRPYLTRLTAWAPVTGSVVVPSLTQLNQSPAALPPNPSPIENDHTPDERIAFQQAEKANVIAEPPLSTDCTPHPSHTQGFTSAPLATNSVHIAQATSIPGPSVPESIVTAATGDSDSHVPGEASHDPRQSAPSAAEIASTIFMRSDDRTPQIHTI